LRVRGLGWFPNARNPRVLLAGVTAGEALPRLARAIDAALHSIGVPKDDRDYSPHLTLARIRDHAPLDALRKAVDSAEDTEFGSFVADEFYLYLSAAGKYTKLAQFGLARGADPT
jgi:RNA 2',3'-cyclic 3'-phosphodiesterase